MEKSPSVCLKEPGPPLYGNIRYRSGPFAIDVSSTAYKIASNQGVNTRDATTDAPSPLTSVIYYWKIFGVPDALPITSRLSFYHGRLVRTTRLLAAINDQSVGEIIGGKGDGDPVAKENFNPEPGHPAG